jgi:hypothetical protein
VGVDSGNRDKNAATRSEIAKARMREILREVASMSA